MSAIFSILAGLVSLYSLLILIRIIISWFGGASYGRPFALLASITDPYLDFWRRNLNLRVGFLDFSVLAAIVSLSVMQHILYSIANFGRISLGTILAILLISVWSVISFILGFFIIIFILRLIAYLTNRNIYSPFWRIVDSISQPVLYRLNRIFFGSRIANYLNGLIFSILLLAAAWICGRFLMPLLAGLLSGLPV